MCIFRVYGFSSYQHILARASVRAYVTASGYDVVCWSSVFGAFREILVHFRAFYTTTWEFCIADTYYVNIDVF